ncbi:MAG: lytic transglycosylase, partial [Ramlibacter sp.]
MIQILRIAGLTGMLWLAGCAAVPPAPASTAAPAIAAPVVQAPPPAVPVIPSGPLQPITAAEAAARGVAQLQPPADLWERIRRGFRMPNLEGDLVRQQ